MEDPKTTGELAQYLGFCIADEEYAISILRVKEILEYDTITRVPGTPPCVRGVFNLRGSVVPVVDLALKFGLPASRITKRTCIVVVEVDLDRRRTVMGVIADAVSQVLDLGSGDVEPPPAFGTRVHMDHLLGMGKAGKKFILLLDINRVLSANELMEVTKLQQLPSGVVPAAAGGTA
ncbi:MAG TPA: chemotaxis protein CheW [Vicinamibacteria bacterium]|nr:chemotaxis protein CheW [Vicinamibacteria bacterium]